MTRMTLETTPRIVSDPVGFPMVWREEVAAYVHWLPITKIQFEYFLCDVPDAHFNAQWYDEILELNPRVTPSDLSTHNYWGTLMTGVQPGEAQRFSYWCGDEFRLLTETQWLALYRGLANQPRQNLSVFGLLEGCSPRVRQLLERMEQASLQACHRMGGTPSLADQMLLRFGGMEWIQTGSPPASWSLKGEPLPEFCGNLEAPQEPTADIQLNLETDRIPAAGFRLLFVPSASKGTKRKSDDLSLNGG